MTNNEEVTKNIEESTASTGDKDADMKRGAEISEASTTKSAKDTVENGALSDVDRESLTGWKPLDTLDSSWKPHVLNEFSKPYFKRLLSFLDSEFKSQTIYPAAAEVFSAFNLCPLDQVKVSMHCDRVLVLANPMIVLPEALLFLAVRDAGMMYLICVVHSCRW
jgi:hypothetical protein